MTFKVSAKGKLISDSLQQNLEKMVESAVYEATGDLITQLKERTSQGVGYDGSSFGKYSKQYAAFREEHGRRSSPVNLFFDGEMLRSIKHKVKKISSGFQAIVYFASTLANTKALNIQFNQNRRFFGMSTDEELNFRKRVNDLIDLKEANR